MGFAGSHAPVDRIQDSPKERFHLFIVVLCIIGQVGPGQSDRHGHVGYFRLAIENRIYGVALLRFLSINGPIIPVIDHRRLSMFVSVPEFTDELTFKYSILINGELLTGEVTHVNIPAGRENHSVMYVPPVVLARFNNNRPLAPNAVQNIAVQIAQRGAVKSELSLMRAPPQWYNAVQGIAGFVLNKNETTVAPLLF